MAWRVFNSLLVLRGQVNELAPNRGKGADGTICDTNHPTTSDHCPHNVPGVGPEMVSALDLTHDPAGGFDSYRFAEVLRINRDKRIKYVISNKRVFDSSGSDAWTWRAYSGTDPHTNHVHISVLDAAISDTTTPWNLEGFMATQFNSEDKTVLQAAPWQYSGRGIGENNGTTVAKSTLAYFDEVLDNSRGVITDVEQVNTKVDEVKAQLDQLEAKLDLILAKLAQSGGGMTFPAQSTFGTTPLTGTIFWNTPEQ